MKEKLLKMLRGINSDINYDSEKSLVENGIFDSLEIMQIVVGIEEKFDIEIEPDDIIPENFDSVDAMLRLIEKIGKE